MNEHTFNGKKTPIKTVSLTGFTREEYRKILQKEKKELKKARGYGLTDQEILDALRSGDEHHKAYARFIEFFIMKAG